MAGCMKKLGRVFLLLIVLYFVVAAVFLRFFVERVAVAKGDWTAEMLSELQVSFPQVKGRHLFGRVRGNGHSGCVAIFPGRHGPSSAYEQAVVPPLLQRDLRVYLIAYPGQFGADSAASLGELPSLAGAAVEQIARDCPFPKIVLVGRSLGSMIAAYATERAHAAGLVLESTTPRFSTFVRTTLRTRWYLQPLLVLPVQQLLAEDYSLNSALKDVHRPVVIFQGTDDEVTPIADFATESLPNTVKLISVENATHSNVYALALSQYVETIADMLNQPPTP